MQADVSVAPGGVLLVVIFVTLIFIAYCGYRLFGGRGFRQISRDRKRQRRSKRVERCVDCGGEPLPGSDRCQQCYEANGW